MENPPSKLRKIFRWSLRVFKYMCIGLLIYVAILLVGLIPVNNDFVPTEDGITLYIISNAVHADIIVPKVTSIVDWSEEFPPDAFASEVIDDASHVAFGWGDKGFFLETETWDDLRLSVTANALLLPSESCAHVSFTRPDYFANATSVTISAEQYQLLVGAIYKTLKRNSDGGFEQIPGYAYSVNDAFFEANGRYHLFNTCNSWVGRALKAGGVRVPLFSPMPNSPTLYLE